MTDNPNRRGQVSAQVHRFRDYVALYVGTGETVYLKPADARKPSPHSRSRRDLRRINRARVYY